MRVVLKFSCMLVKIALAPATGFGLLLDVAFGNMSRADAWEWLSDNEWFCLSMVGYLVFAGFLIGGAL